MKKKLAIISAAAVLALGGLATVAGTIGSGNMSITKAATAHVDHGDSDGEEHAFYAPGVKDDKGIAYETGNKPYWRCNSCCSSNPDSARYDLNGHTKALTLADVQIPALTKATAADVTNGDKISTVYLNKFRYVDQGYGETPADQKDGGEGTPWYVKDTIDGQEKTAIYFSRSGKTGSPDNKNTEFRFLDDSVSAVSSVSFWYRYKNWGTGTATDSVNFTNLCQFVVNISDKDVYYGVPNKLENDDTWHYITINYSEFDSSATTQPNFKGFLFKFADLRGYIMISGLTYGYTADVTLKNTSADGTDKTEAVSVGSLPTAPTMDGKKFLGWYDESGNKVESVTSSTTTLVAKWGANSSGSSDSFDYMGNLSEKVAALPDEITDDNVDDAILRYKEYAKAASIAEANMTAYEKANYSVPDKVTTVKTKLAGKTTEVLSLPSSGEGWGTANSLDIYSNANFGVSFSNNAYYPVRNASGGVTYGDSGTINFINIYLQSGGYKESKTYWFDFPKINYKAYSSVTFKLYSDSGISKSYVIKADGNVLYSGKEWVNAQYSPLVTISTTNGTTTLVADYYDTEYSVKLSDEVANGTKALRLERTREIAEGDTGVGFDNFGFSSLTATI